MTDNPKAPPPVPEDSGLSPEQLELAKSDIQSLLEKPEIYIKMVDYIKQLESEQDAREDAEGDEVVLKYGRKDGLGEAGGVVWGVIKSGRGNEICITARNHSVKDAFDEFYDTVKYAIEVVGGELEKTSSDTPPPVAQQTPQASPQPQTPQPVQQTAPQPVQQTPPQPVQPQTASPTPEGEGEIEVFAVKSVAHNRSKTGIDVLQVKGGKYSKFGHTAWPEHVPPTVQYTGWPIGEEYTPPDEMKYAWLDTSKNRFVAFAPEEQR